MKKSNNSQRKVVDSFKSKGVQIDISNGSEKPPLNHQQASTLFSAQ